MATMHPTAWGFAGRAILLLSTITFGLAFDMPPAAAVTITVTTTNDELNADGDCSLREAFQSANDDDDIDDCDEGNGDDVITLAPSATYELDICEGENEDASFNDVDDLDLAGEDPASLTINGNGSTIRQTCDPARVIHVEAPGETLTINDTTITGGMNQFGAGIVLTDGDAVTLNRSRVEDNHNDNGDACCAGVDVDDENGEGLLTLVDTVVTNNTTTDECCAAVSAFELVMLRSAVTDNHVFGEEGECCAGIEYDGDATITDSVVSGNTNEVDGGFGGAGIISENAPLTLVRSSVLDNTSGGDMAGVLVEDAEGLVVDSTVARNHAEDEFSGIAADESDLTVINSTVSENTVGDNECCAGITGFESTITLVHVTLVGNEAEAGHSAVGGFDENTIDLVSFGSVIIGGGPADACNFLGEVDSLGYNLVGDDTCGLDDPTDGPVTDPMLGALANNGGTTLTHLPATGSPLIDGIPTEDCSDDSEVAADQRGVDRPQQEGCDVGAVEVQAEEPAPTPTPTPRAEPPAAQPAQQQPTFTG